MLIKILESEYMIELLELRQTLKSSKISIVNLCSREIETRRFLEIEDDKLTNSYVEK